MVSRSTLIRTARFVGICLAVSFVVLNVVLRVETYRFQLRAERLMADVQALKLRQSNWLEAEPLISRWGKYGHYEGHCDASFCRYLIDLRSPGMAVGNAGFWRYLNNRFVRSIAPFIFDYSGGRIATLRTTFVVQDSVVLRKSAVFTYDVPSTSSGARDAAIDHVQSKLHHTAASVSPSRGHLSSSRKLASLRLRPWGPPSPPNQTHTEYAPLPLACRIPLFARGREAGQILSVTAVSESQERQSGEVIEKATVRLNGVLKGETGYKPGELISVTSRSYSNYSPFAIETPLTPDKQFLLLPVYREDKSYPLELERCLVLPDTPETRNQLEAGVAQNDSLRYPDPRASNFIPD